MSEIETKSRLRREGDILDRLDNVKRLIQMEGTRNTDCWKEVNMNHIAQKAQRDHKSEWIEKLRLCRIIFLGTLFLSAVWVAISLISERVVS